MDLQFKPEVSRSERKGDAVAILFSFVSLLACGLASRAHAVPTRIEVLRSEKLKTIVYKDRTDPATFWFVPPVKLYQDEGKVVFYRKPAANGKVNYSFYVVPYMTDAMRTFLTGEIPGFQNSSQLKPVTARGFGIQVKQFDSVSYLGEKITDYQYLNNPHLVRVSVSKSQAEEFDFFLRNKPGIQANVLIDFETERVKKDLKMELSSKEIYNNLKIGVGARIMFVQAELERNITDLLAKKYTTVVGKGDLVPPEFMKTVIRQCFEPVKKQGNRFDPDDESWRENYDPVQGITAPESGDLEAQLELADSLLVPQPEDAPFFPVAGGNSDDEGGGFPIPGMGKPGKTSDGVYFTYKRELINADRTCGFTSVEWMDSSEVVGIPVYLTLKPGIDAAAGAHVETFPRREVTVDGSSTSEGPVSTGIQVKPGDQFVLSTDFACLVKGPYYDRYQPRIPALVWKSEWGSPDDQVYFRVGSSPWNPIGKRALIQADSIFAGELQFYVNKDAIWEKLPADLKKARFLAPPVLRYEDVNPRFVVAINGRRVELK